METQEKLQKDITKLKGGVKNIREQTARLESMLMCLLEQSGISDFKEEDFQEGDWEGKSQRTENVTRVICKLLSCFVNIEYCNGLFTIVLRRGYLKRQEMITGIISELNSCMYCVTVKDVYADPLKGWKI